jgi:hypothetical protein
MNRSAAGAKRERNRRAYFPVAVPDANRRVVDARPHEQTGSCGPREPVSGHAFVGLNLVEIDSERVTPPVARLRDAPDPPRFLDDYDGARTNACAHAQAQTHGSREPGAWRRAPHAHTRKFEPRRLGARSRRRRECEREHDPNERRTAVHVRFRPPPPGESSAGWPAAPREWAAGRARTPDPSVGGVILDSRPRLQDARMSPLQQAGIRQGGGNPGVDRYGRCPSRRPRKPEDRAPLARLEKDIDDSLRVSGVAAAARLIPRRSS